MHNLRYTFDTVFIAENKGDLHGFSDKVETERRIKALVLNKRYLQNAIVSSMEINPNIENSMST